MALGAEQRGWGNLHRGDLGDLRAWQRLGARRGAVACPGHVPDLARAERADDGACGHRLCQDEEAQARAGGDQLDRARVDQPGDGGGARACEPAAGAADPVRHLRRPRPRPGAAADRGLRRRHGERERRAAPGEPLLRPDPAARTSADGAAAGAGDDDGPGQLRAGDAGLSAGRAGRGLGLPGRLLRAEGLADPSPRARSGRGDAGGRAAESGREADDRLGRRGDLCAGRGGTP